MAEPSIHDVHISITCSRTTYRRPAESLSGQGIPWHGLIAVLVIVIFIIVAIAVCTAGRKRSRGLSWNGWWDGSDLGSRRSFTCNPIGFTSSRRFRGVRRFTSASIPNRRSATMAIGGVLGSSAKKSSLQSSTAMRVSVLPIPISRHRVRCSLRSRDRPRRSRAVSADGQAGVHVRITPKQTRRPSFVTQAPPMSSPSDDGLGRNVPSRPPPVSHGRHR
jgi:hypothetical protein